MLSSDASREAFRMIGEKQPVEQIVDVICCMPDDTFRQFVQQDLNMRKRDNKAMMKWKLDVARMLLLQTNSNFGTIHVFQR